MKRLCFSFYNGKYFTIKCTYVGSLLLWVSVAVSSGSYAPVAYHTKLFQLKLFSNCLC